MSRFYSYKELIRNPPEKETVTAARDSVQRVIDRKCAGAIIYGSSAWSFDLKTPDQHSRRSDIDVAVEDYDSLDGQTDQLDDILNETGVKVNITCIHEQCGTDDYFAWDEPEHLPAPLHDHLRNLARHLGGGHKKFYENLPPPSRNRDDDLEQYIALYEGFSKEGLFIHTPETFCSNESNSNLMLDLIGRMENFPDSIIRRALAIERILPAIDSKHVVRQAFRSVPHTWPLRTAMLAHFENIWVCSNKYEQLINDVLDRKVKEIDYVAAANAIATSLVYSVRNSIIDFYQINPDYAGITIFPKGTDVEVKHTSVRNGSMQYNARLLNPLGKPSLGLHLAKIDDGKQVEAEYTVYSIKHSRRIKNGFRLRTPQGHLLISQRQPTLPF